MTQKEEILFNLLAGALLARELTSAHEHECDVCGNVWAHRASDMTSEAAYHAGHTCSVCGAQQFVKRGR